MLIKIKDENKTPIKLCCICGEEIKGYGNNAEPMKQGTCCDECNEKFVIPSRIKQLMEKRG